MTFISPKAALPISSNEFWQMFTKCLPPSGWNPKLQIAVGNSGGPDSTCLLFLINRLLNERKSSRDSAKLPPSVVSLTVDHGLQEASAAMAAHSANTAASLGVKHHSLPIPWSKSPFPPKPLAAFEETARDARFHVLFQAMTRTKANVLAFGHHADDQVETSLMRLARGTTEVGAAGMRRCRRWGMGIGAEEGELGWAGLEGMNRWIVRPLLEVRKDRILATCHEHGLEYVTDQTNFQPEITLRNAIRRMLAEEEATGKDTKLELHPAPQEMSPEIKEALEKVKSASANFQTTILDISGGKEQLRGAVKYLSSHVEDIDHQATIHLKQQSLQSPTSTFLLSTHNLSSITENAIQRAMILRVMRYVSFHPWGSIRADGNRRRSSIERIINVIWSRQPSNTRPASFTAGGGVLWSPTILAPDGRLKKIGNRTQTYFMKPGDRFAWLASRLPAVPIQAFPKSIDVLPPQLNVDITLPLLELLEQVTAGKTKDPFLDILFDCRFSLRFDVSKMPENVATALVNHTETGQTLRVVPDKRFYWPRVMLQTPLHPDRVLATYSPIARSPLEDREHWVTMEWIRLLDAT